VATLSGDFSGVTDLDRALSVVSGPRCVAEAVARRLASEEIPDFPGYGFNLDDAIGSALPEYAIRQGVKAQVFAEEEVLDAQIVVTKTTSEAGDSLAADIKIDTIEGPASLTVAASELDGVTAIIPR
jgi:hypothetical protein